MGNGAAGTTRTVDGFTLKMGGEANLDLVRPLWEKLNRMHSELSPHFKQRYQKMDWQWRKAALLKKSKAILLKYVVDDRGETIVGYCISSIAREDETVGEIDSLYIAEEYRKAGIGKLLMFNAIQWLNGRGVKTQRLLVGVGNERAIEYYRQFGFHPLHIVLQKREE